MTKARYSAVAGVLGAACIGSLPMGLLWPEFFDTLFRPYGLYISLGILAGGVVLPIAAAVLGSKRWLFVSALGAAVVVWFFGKVLQ